MDENHPVLDVTYGNFACRLEGFEDSVETMKVVVSFFHELAGHDRFMDTEPLAPDMETLARLTEEQTGQPVEAEGYDNKVSLRVRTEVVADDAAEEPAAEEIEETFVEEVAEEIVEADEAENEAEELSSVAEKLQRMRAAAARKIPAASEDFSEDLNETAAAAVANPLSQRLTELVKRTTQAEQDADLAPDASEEPAVAEEAFDDTAETDMVAEDQPSDEETMTEEEVNVFSDEAEDDAAQAAQDDAFVLNDPIEGPDAEIDDLDDADAEDEAEVAETEESDAPVEATEDDTFDAEAASDDEELNAFLAEEDEVWDEVASTQDKAEAETDDVAAEADTPDTDDKSDAAQDTAAPLVLTPADQAKDEPVAEEDHDDYNDDDEFDLEAEVAKVEAELAAREGTDLASRGLPRHVEDAMSRIMSQTDQHLNQPENRRHRDAFAQLKAAVAATEAARQLGDKGSDKQDPDEVYKDDLGAHGDHEKGERALSTPLKLVRTQELKAEQSLSKSDAAIAEGMAEAAASEGETAAAPGAEADTNAAPSARLREIATMKEAQSSDDGNDFAAFVASHGATDLADQLEAAGAYICFVEGDADFSRPQVMKLVQSAADAEITREDGLRSFGRLLRQARLIKLANGRFQVSENTQYRPDDHHAAQG